MPIFDQGYQHWSGELSGHAWRWLAITRHGVRTGMKNRVLRYVLFLAWMPAMALAGILCVWGMAEHQSTLIAPVMQALAGLLQPQLVADPHAYRVDVWKIAYSWFLWTELRFSMVLILLVGPSLISQDLRFNALPLYFSRPLRRIDYFLGKLGVIMAFLAMVVILPSIAAYVLGLAFSLDLSIIPDTFRILLSSILYGMIIALSAGTFILALSTFSRNSRYIALLWLGIWFVSGIVGAILQQVAMEQRQHAMYAQMATRRPSLPRNPTTQEMTEYIRAQPAYDRARREAEEAARIEEANAVKTDWRPMVSYTANLERIGQQLLGTDATWEKLSQLRLGRDRDRILRQYRGPQYPWYWSAFVLVGLFGLSVCMLNYSIKSLDRLK
jgi:ABC-2 type transport system permease protein